MDRTVVDLRPTRSRATRCTRPSGYSQRALHATEWNAVFPNAVCIVAMLSRFIENAANFVLEGERYRRLDAQRRPPDATPHLRAVDPIAFLVDSVADLLEQIATAICRAHPRTFALLGRATDDHDPL